MKEEGTANDGRSSSASTDEISEERLQELRNKAIRGAVGNESDTGRSDDLVPPSDQKGGLQPTDPDDLADDRGLGNHSATEDMSASETRELIDAVSAENGRMNGNHSPTTDSYFHDECNFNRGRSPGDGSLNRFEVRDDAEAPNHFESRAATRVGSKQQRHSESGSSEFNRGWTDTSPVVNDRDGSTAIDTSDMNSLPDYERLAKHNDGTSPAWSSDPSRELQSGVGGSFSEHAAEQDKLLIAETYCRRLELADYQTEQVLGKMQYLDLQKFGRENSLEKVSLAVINHFASIDHLSRFREGEENPLARDFRELREDVGMSQSQLKEFTAKI